VACGAPGRETEKPAPGVNSRAEGQRRAFSDRLNIIGRCGVRAREAAERGRESVCVRVGVVC